MSPPLLKSYYLIASHANFIPSPSVIFHILKNKKKQEKKILENSCPLKIRNCVRVYNYRE
jgi:hypothetical protein